MSKTQPECRTCPMDEIRTGFYRCKKCGYEKDYRRRIAVQVQFAWYDLWVGMFWDRKTRVLYVCPLPCVLLVFQKTN